MNNVKHQLITTLSEIRSSINAKFTKYFISGWIVAVIPVFYFKVAAGENIYLYLLTIGSVFIAVYTGWLYGRSYVKTKQDAGEIMVTSLIIFLSALIIRHLVSNPNSYDFKQAGIMESFLVLTTNYICLVAGASSVYLTWAAIIRIRFFNK